MTQYLVLAGHDNPLEDLLPINPQPATIGMEHTRRQFAASGIVIDELPFVSLNWSMLDRGAEYQALLAQFDLTTATTADVSVYVQDEYFNWVLRNGTAVKPFIGQDGSRTQFFLRDFTILIKSLRAQA